jgi:hypothetical protein
MVSHKARGRPRARRRETAPTADLPPNVIPLRQRIMPRHTALLARWLEAGRRMGLCDASAFANEGERAVELPRQDYILVWVRENIDPAYLVTAEGVHWVVVDAVRQITLARLSSFEAALDFIRPVLPLERAA